MNERAERLQATAEAQVADLIDLVSRADPATLRRPCPGREKLGDGTIAANAWHVAENYRRIADFTNSGGQGSGGHEPRMHGAGRLPRLLRAIGHRAPGHGPGGGGHDQRYSADEFDAGALLEQLAAVRGDVSRIGLFTGQQLDEIPANGSFRFCDGERSREQVLTSLLKHQAHQLDALKAALA
jgi:hypothetical protein